LIARKLHAITTISCKLYNYMVFNFCFHNAKKYV
jgi:hypothetical protein